MHDILADIKNSVYSGLVFLCHSVYVLVCVQKVQERWYEKLHEWEKALSAYERQQEKNPDDSNFLYGRMRCLEALGEWCVFVL